MADQRDGENGIEMLRRMISYIREEANRLRILDVALLLEHAEDAVAAFAPSSPGDRRCSPARRGETRIEH